MEVLNIRLPVNHKIDPFYFQWKDHEVRIKGILAFEARFSTEAGESLRNLSIWLDMDEGRLGNIAEIPPSFRNVLSMRQDPNDPFAKASPAPFVMPVYTYRCFRLEGNGTFYGKEADYQNPNATVEERMNMLDLDISANEGIQLPPGTMDAAVRLVCTLCLLDNDPELIDRDILAKDRAKWERAATEEEIALIVGRALRKDKIGWNIGQRYDERGPYLVPPHPQGFWIGAGRHQLIIKTRKGWVTKKHMVTNVPSGYDKEAPEEPVV
jgi:hypothetical protein